MNRDDRQPEPPATDDSARLWLARRLVRAAVRRYQATNAFAQEVDRRIPERHRVGSFTVDADDYEGEQRAWLRLRQEANAEFYSAEVDLATRINNLFDALAPEALRVGDWDRWETYPERAVTVDGRTYSVQFDPGQYDPGSCIIAVFPVERTISLDD